MSHEENKPNYLAELVLAAQRHLCAWEELQQAEHAKDIHRQRAKNPNVMLQSAALVLDRQARLLRRQAEVLTATQAFCEWQKQQDKS